MLKKPTRESRVTRPLTVNMVFWRHDDFCTHGECCPKYIRVM